MIGPAGFMAAPKQAKPNHQACWNCNRKFRGNHFTTVETKNGLVHVHKQCAEEMKREEQR